MSRLLDAELKSQVTRFNEFEPSGSNFAESQAGLNLKANLIKKSKKWGWFFQLNLSPNTLRSSYPNLDSQPVRKVFPLYLSLFSKQTFMLGPRAHDSMSFYLNACESLLLLNQQLIV